MNFENREIDEQKLMEEIDMLDDEPGTKDNSSQPIKSKKSKNFVFVVLLFLVLGAYTVYEQFLKSYIYGYYNLESDYSEESYLEVYEKNKEKFEKLKNNIDVKYVNESDQGTIFSVENNNDEQISGVYVYIIFYDAENKPIYIDDQYIEYIGAGGKRYINAFDVPKDYDHFNMLAMKNDFSNFKLENLAKDINYNTSETNSRITINGVNKSNKKVDAVFSMIWYDKNDKIVDVEYVRQMDIKPNKKFEINKYKYGEEKCVVNLDYALSY